MWTHFQHHYIPTDCLNLIWSHEFASRQDRQLFARWHSSFLHLVISTKRFAYMLLCKKNEERIRVYEMMLQKREFEENIGSTHLIRLSWSQKCCHCYQLRAVKIMPLEMNKMPLEILKTLIKPQATKIQTDLHQFSIKRAFEPQTIMVHSALSEVRWSTPNSCCTAL